MTHRILYTDTPHNGKYKICAFCLLTKKIKMKCSGCRKIYYCNYTCQKNIGFIINCNVQSPMLHNIHCPDSLM